MYWSMSVETTPHAHGTLPTEVQADIYKYITRDSKTYATQNTDGQWGKREWWAKVPPR